MKTIKLLELFPYLYPLLLIIMTRVKFSSMLDLIISYKILFLYTEYLILIVWYKHINWKTETFAKLPSSTLFLIHGMTFFRRSVCISPPDPSASSVCRVIMGTPRRGSPASPAPVPCPSGRTTSPPPAATTGSPSAAGRTSCANAPWGTRAFSAKGERRDWDACEYCIAGIV